MKGFTVTAGKKSMKLLDGHVYFTPTSLCFFAIGIGWMLAEYALHRDATPSFAAQNLIFFWMASPGMAVSGIFLVMGRGHLVNEEIFGGWQRVIVETVACTIAVVLVNAIIGFFQERGTYFISTIEKFLFYALSAPVAEESLYRVTICTVVVVVVMAAFDMAGWSKKNQQQVKLNVARVTAVLVSGVAFSLSHLGVYGDEPLMLLSTLIGGTIMATFYVYTKNPFVPLFAHFVNNALAAGVIITNAVVAIT